MLYRLSIDSAVNGSSGYDSGYSGRSSSSSSVVSNPDMQVRRKQDRDVYIFFYFTSSHHITRIYKHFLLCMTLTEFQRWRKTRDDDDGDVICFDCNVMLSPAFFFLFSRPTSPR